VQPTATPVPSAKKSPGLPDPHRKAGPHHARPHTQPPPPHRRYESIPQAAERAGVTTRTIRRWIAQGELTGFRMGKRMIRLDADELDKRLRPIPAAGGR